MNRNNDSGLNVQWRSCLSTICLRQKIAATPTDYAANIITLHILLRRVDTGMTVPWHTSWVVIYWPIYSSNHYPPRLQSRGSRHSSGLPGPTFSDLFIYLREKMRRFPAENPHCGKLPFSDWGMFLSELYECIYLRSLCQREKCPVLKGNWCLKA